MTAADLSRAIADMPCRCTEDDACAAHTALEELVAVQPVRVSDDDVARAFHEAYERLAPGFGYKTRDASAVPWEDVPENNRALMSATVQQVWLAIGRLSPAAAPTITSVADDKMDDLAESFVPTLDSLISSVIRDESLPDARNAAARRCASIAWHEGARRG